MLHMKMLMTVTISMILEMYSIFYDNSNSCYNLDYINIYHVLLLTYDYDVFITHSHTHTHTHTQLISYLTGIEFIYIFDFFYFSVMISMKGFDFGNHTFEF